MAGHYAAMSEFLYRGYNVAVPSVDVGDDVYVVEDGDGTMWRLQVKTADCHRDERDDHGKLVSVTGTYGLSRRQLAKAKANELFFIFVVRWEARWRFILISRNELREVRERMVAADRGGRPGRPPVSDHSATSDRLTLDVMWSPDDAKGWGASFAPYLDRWPATFPENPGGPGAANAVAAP